MFLRILSRKVNDFLKCDQHSDLKCMHVLDINSQPANTAYEENTNQPGRQARISWNPGFNTMSSEIHFFRLYNEADGLDLTDLV